ncbi:hypothetical protein [Isoptericola cucumis]|uniref:Lipoprotein n=1 Tax=Isoptericola cucumis TaxID=1776856 RepID=A0ABQ2BCD8_9MICO|nr:hypothetical protein [Isoptericola cucumis]GGI10783.1 hypothetical protein GCM10007368_32950 [Isoptericola cucumis]
MHTEISPTDDRPLTTTDLRTPQRRLLGILAVAAGVVVTTTACAGLTESLAERADGHTKTFEYSSGAAGKDAEVLPAWAPDDATDVRGVFRTTGDEVILSMSADLDDLPAGCEAVSAKNPLAARPDRGTLEPEDYRDASTLEAGWWTAGQEQSATLMCGRWWVGEQDGTVFAFTPELKQVEVEEQPDAA